MTRASIPSPSEGVWHLGPLPLRAYALCIIIGIVIAIVVGERRLVVRGADRGVIADLAFLAVPLGIIGGRIYHVITTPGPYFGSGGDPVSALYIWKGGLGIWGAIFLGGVGAWIACRRAGVLLPPVADAVAPGLALAQAAGRWGNWFNQELFGRPTDLPWALEIDPDNPDALVGESTYHPTFLYESLWCLGVAVLIIWADRRFKLGHGQVFALYLAGYTAGRGWIEALRIDEAERILGLRLNNWTSLLLFLGAVSYFILSRRRYPDRELTPYRVTPATPGSDVSDGDSPATATPGSTAADEANDPRGP